MLEITPVWACNHNSAGLFDRLLNPIEELKGQGRLKQCGSGLRVGFAIWQKPQMVDALDMDDLRWEVHANVPHGMRDGFEEVFQMVKLVTTVSAEASSHMRRYRSGRIEVCRTGIKETDWPPVREPQEQRVLWRGSRGWTRAVAYLPDNVIRWGNVPNAKVPFMAYKDYLRTIRTAERTLEICPSYDAPFERSKSPVKMYQAMAQGVATIVSHLPPYGPEAIDGETAIVFRDPKELPNLIRWLLKDHEKRRQIARRGREWVLAERNVKTTALDFERAWEYASRT